jgi:hypothetical protein
MTIIYVLIFIVLFYQFYRYLCKNINYSQFEHFYNNSDLLYNTINAGLHSSNNTFEGFNKLNTTNPNLITNYVYSTPDRVIQVSPYWYSPLDYWLNPYVYYNWYGGRSSGSYSTSYSPPVINTHRRHSRSGGYRRSGGYSRSGRSGRSGRR